ncbi:unnamed protein product [Prorocentrum cordatum]|uniref:Uncharacterized protein n=1 Tax=Prorocentrum cordatum TaxID=2364126 RepID=A0ABN9SCV4_9DINO|nr:unnamed protein product [Polarella glacialis]
MCGTSPGSLSRVSGQWRRTLIRCPGSVSLWRPRRAGPWPCCAPPSHHLAAWGRRIFFRRRWSCTGAFCAVAPQPRHTARRPGQGAGRRKRSSSSSLSRSVTLLLVVFPLSTNPSNGVERTVAPVWPCGHPHWPVGVGEPLACPRMRLGDEYTAIV